jgi:mannan endo-1,4-beta-mannosidase
MTIHRRIFVSTFTFILTAHILSASVQGQPASIDIFPDKVIGPISPYVYGMNAQKFDSSLGSTVRRMGGNRQTGYNWVINASSAGSDWKHFNDDWPCQILGYKNSAEPGAQVTNFVRDNLKLGMDSLITIPLVDFVAGDKKGEVSESEKAPSTRFKHSLPTKKGPYTLTPNPEDKEVYQDEFVNFLVHKLKKAEQGGIKFYCLDNEPGLWSHTHPRIHPRKVAYKELVERSEAMAEAITRLDSGAQVFGPVLYGWGAYMNLQNAPDAKEFSARYPTFIDFYLTQMKALEERHNRRLLHVLDLHWYPEARGGGRRITEPGIDADIVKARLQATRSLWDASYVEDSWITQNSTNRKPIRLIPWIKEKIEKNYPGTKLAFTEYDFGAGHHVSGGLAQADVLGIFGREGVYLACYWGDLKHYIAAAMKLYRNYDGKGSRFGDRAVVVAGNDPSRFSVYAAVDSGNPAKLAVVLVNKDLKEGLRGKIRIANKIAYQVSETYGFDASSPEIRPMAGFDFKDGHLEYSLPPMSAALVALNAK